jgi:hypothetical protein
MTAGAGPEVELVVPDGNVTDQLVLADLQSVALVYLSRGHTNGGLLVGTSTTLYASDLAEPQLHPSFEDAYPQDWGDERRRRSEFLTPGHSRPCSDQFVNHDHTRTGAVRQATQSIPGPSDAMRAIPGAAYGPEQSRWFIQRLQAMWARG